MEKKLDYIGLKYKVTLVRWNDEWKHWRGGLDWKGEHDFEYVVEKPTVTEVVDALYKYAKEN